MNLWIVIFIAVVLLLLVGGAYRRRFQEATLHWGRVITGQGHIERDIQEARDAGDTVHAAELLGRSIHYRGFQDALTPPHLTNLTIAYWIACGGTYLWGFFILPWYVALPWPMFFGIAQRRLKRWLPAPGSDHYRQKIIRSLMSRRTLFDRQGDRIRMQAADYMLTMLRRSDF